ncbi:MAG: hypothetical protein HY934_08410 [Candidatus Firestonebacteria bacterium]|nr:hypothetical protein [Candidatus Firestonebacteria bacterium]
MKKYFFLVFVFIFLACTPSFLYINAEIINSGHNILRQTAGKLPTSPGIGKAGVCSFCHIPHSATGATMWIVPSDVYRPISGEVGRICGSALCHGAIGNAAPDMTKSIYRPTGWEHANHPLLDNDTDIYSDVLLDNDGRMIGNGGTKQWMSRWPATERNRRAASYTDTSLYTSAMECTSCHNVHSVTKDVIFKQEIDGGELLGKGASGEFLRARALDTTGILGDTTDFNEIDGSGRKQIFCEFCHVGRATSGWGAWNSTFVDGVAFSTHPVGRGDTDRDGRHDDRLNSTNIRKIYDDDKGCESSIIIPKEMITGVEVTADKKDQGGHLGGLAGIGYETGAGAEKIGLIICQTCHKPHNEARAFVGQLHNGEYIDTTMFGPKTPDLLVFNNSSKSGYNILCEKCHAYRPFLRINPEFDSSRGDEDSTGAGHPLRHHRFIKGDGNYKYNENGDIDSTWSIKNDLCDEGPAIDIPLSWPTAGTNQVVCLSCHDVHGGRPGTKLLRRSTRGNDLICDDCHQRALLKLGLTHPINVGLVNTDGESWPDQANLSVFGPPSVDYNGDILEGTRLKLYSKLSSKYSADKNYFDIKYDTANVKIGCDTCHDWSNGMIHYYAGRRRNPAREISTEAQKLGHKHSGKEDPNHNSELCVSCHTAPDVLNPHQSPVDQYYKRYSSTGVNFDYGSDATRGLFGGLNPDLDNERMEGANPSPWIREYPVSISPYESTRLSRLGTHPSGLRIEHDAAGKKDHYNFIYYTTTGWGGSVWGDSSRCNKKSISVRKSRLVSKWGQKFDILKTMDARKKEENLKEAIIICQSCHTPHWANEGLVEYNSAAFSKEPTPNSALLYATQAESFMCRTCHFPTGTHPVSKPSKIELYSRWETPDIAGDYDSINYVSRTETTIVLTLNEERALPRKNQAPELLRDSTRKDPYGTTWAVIKEYGPMAPANYPKKGGSFNNQETDKRGLPESLVDSSNMMVCDSCHAPHAANTAMGTFILEGIFDTVPGSKDSGADYNAEGKKYNGAAEPTMKRDEPTCYLCHNK